MVTDETDKMEPYHQKSWGGSVAKSETTHEEEIKKMAEVFEQSC